MLKWSIHQAANELGVSRDKIKRGLIQAGIEVSSEKSGNEFTTRQIFAAVAGGDLKAERIRETRARADLLELKRKERERELVPMSEALAEISRVLVPLRGELLALASSVCAAANPGDPELARQVIHDRIIRILSSISDSGEAVKTPAGLPSSPTPDNGQ